MISQRSILLGLALLSFASGCMAEVLIPFHLNDEVGNTSNSNSDSSSGSDEGPFNCTMSEFAENMCLEKLDGTFPGVLLEVFLFFWCFLALAIVCDDYLVLSLETLCLRWGIRDDIAGCTFMAFGSAAPEIIVNAVATMKASDGSTDLGISAIIGSGMIAFMLIPGFCGVFGGHPKPLQLKRRPLARDIIAYSVGIIELCIFFHDGAIKTFEALIMLLTYAIYICVVVVSPRIRARFRKNLPESRQLLPASPSLNGRQIKSIQNVTFYSKTGDECVFHTTGEHVMTFKGTPMGTFEKGVKFILGDNAHEISLSESQPNIELDNKGCERAIAKIVRILETRDIPIIQEWKTGSNVAGYHTNQDKFLNATVAARDDEDGSYTVRWNDGTESSGLPFSDLRPVQSTDSSFTDKIDTLAESHQKRSEALKYAFGIGALDRKQYELAINDLNQRVARTDYEYDSSSDSGSTGYSAISMWRHQWWRDDNNRKKSRFAVYLKPFMVFVDVWRFVFKYTIPAYETPDTEEQGLDNDEKEPEVWYREKIYPLTFTVSFIWVAVFSFVISNIASRWADKSGLGTGFMGLLMISIGAEIPDCIQSVTVAKRGYGSMACSNAIGSQNVNVFIGLGLPWLISNLAKGEHIHVENVTALQGAAYFQAGGVCLNVGMTLGLAYYHKLNKASLGKQKGIALVCAYFGVIAAFAVYSQTA
eukprot:TRINITY_DN11420_c0_g1_i1.p1 TRINITY_DN11420_c0_g1~~TRINITY_DN11420_c0_g1_i1.p1  ORF type:complete len:735 (+),score=57.64 TRINITY_DN11420_c0_g1_i1:97-2205(+)